MKSFFLPLSLVFAIQAAEPAAPVAPAIPAEVEAEYYRADGAVAHMQSTWEAANADLQKAAAALGAACGARFVPFVQGKHLVCTPKPEDPPKAVPQK